MYPNPQHLIAEVTNLFSYGIMPAKKKLLNEKSTGKHMSAFSDIQSHVECPG
jgi:hypothetical protein